MTSTQQSITPGFTAEIQFVLLSLHHLPALPIAQGQGEGLETANGVDPLPELDVQFE
jgi:hypothetical protein